MVFGSFGRPARDRYRPGCCLDYTAWRTCFAKEILHQYGLSLVAVRQELQGTTRAGSIKSAHSKWLVPPFMIVTTTGNFLQGRENRINRSVAAQYLRAREALDTPVRYPQISVAILTGESLVGL